MHLAKQDLSEHTTHDLAAPRLGQIRHDVYLFGSRKRPDAFSDLQDELLLQTVELPAAVVLDGHERVDGLTGHVVGDGDGRGFGHGGMLEQCGLDLGRREAMAADVDDVIDAPADPVVSVVIAGGQVAGELVEVLSARCREFLLEKKGEKKRGRPKKKTCIDVIINPQVGVHKPLVGAPDGAGHAWPGLFKDQDALDAPGKDLAAGDGIQYRRGDAKEGEGCAAWLDGCHPGQGGYGVRPSLGLEVCLSLVH